MENKREKPLVIFLHMSKSGGETLKSFLYRLYKKKKEAVYSIMLNEEDGSEERAITDFAAFSDARKNEIEVIAGHMNIGIHKYSNTNDFTYFTFLRNPVDRIISLYYYALGRDTHYMHATIIHNRMNLREFVCSGISTEVDNYQTRLLSGMSHIEIGDCSEEMLMSAKSNIDKYFTFVGITEKYDESLIMLKGIYNWPFPFYRRQNEGTNKPHKKYISKEAIEMIKKYNKFDVELYDYALERFEALLSKQSYAFHVKLKILKTVNKYINKV